MPDDKRKETDIGMRLDDQTRNENTLTASETRYKTIFDSVTDVVLVHDAETGAILDANRKVAELFGYTADEAREITIGDISSGIPPYTQEEAVSRIKAAARQGGSVFEWHCRDKSGRLFWIEVNLKSAVLDGRTRVVATVRDIPRRKQAEESLRESESRYHSLFENNHAVMLLISPGTGRIVDANPAAVAYYGYSREQLTSMVIDEVNALPREEVFREMNLARSQKQRMFKFRHRLASGEIRDVEVYSGPIVVFGETLLYSIVHDVTERKQAEEALSESEERYRSLFETSIDGILLADLDGGIYAANPAACRILQRTEEEIVREGRDGVLDTSDPRFRDVMEERKRTGRARGELIYKRKDGTAFPVEISSSLIRDKHGHISTSVIFRDITKRKQDEEKIRRLNEDLERKVHDRTVALARTVSELKEQREVLQTIVNHIPVMLTFYDSEGKVKLVNREFVRLVGWSEEEARSMDIMAAIYPDPEYRRETWKYMMKAKPGWKDLEVTTRSGDILMSSWANVRLSDGSQIGIGIDISERKRMEQDLLRLFSAIEQTGEGVALIDTDGVIEYVNPAYKDISGYSRDELIGEKVGSFKEYFAGHDLDEMLDRISREGKTWSGRQSRRKKSGELIDVDVTISPVHDKSGRIINYVSVIRDVTREVRMQKQMSQTQKMEAIGALAGGIAHDLKNILTPILINTEMALEDVGSDHPAYPILEEALDAAKLGRDLVQQILTFSKRTPKKKVPVNIPAVVRETMGFLRSTLPSTIDIRNEIEDDCIMACADPTQIKQVLINLGTNAGQAMRDKDGVLEVSESRTVLDEEEASRISPDLSAGPYIQVSMHDTGNGMDEETMQHIFEPFFTTKKGEGTGMGLAVAHGIVKDHQGAIKVRSTPGEGSLFTVLLPVMQGKPEDEKCASPQAGGN